MPDFNRDMGRHDAHIEHLQRQVEDLSKDVHEIKQMLDQAQGGWRMMMAIAGLSGLLGAGATKIASVLSNGQ